MTSLRRLLSLLGLLAAARCAASPSQTQIARNISESITIPPAGYALNFSMDWSCDDGSATTTSAPARIDLLDPSGSLLASLVGSLGASGPLVAAPGLGSLSSVTGSAAKWGAAGTPAEGQITGTWLIPGGTPGTCTVRFWTIQEAQPGSEASTITTQAADAGGSGPVAPQPSPTPTPVTAPSVSLQAPAQACALSSVSLTAGARSDTGTITALQLEVSSDGALTWTPLGSAPQTGGSSATLSTTDSFPCTGLFWVRAVAVDASGLTAESRASIEVTKASQPAPSVSADPPIAWVGQSVALSATAGATGNYSWSGAASGSASSLSVSFASAGTYTVSVIDTGNATFMASPPATTTVTVNAPFYTLATASSAGGTVTGAGSYAPNSVAWATALPDSGYRFSGWSGDASGADPVVSLTMTANRSVVATFSTLVPQTISCDRPASVTTKSPAFALQPVASSGLPVSLALLSGPAALNGSTVSLTGAVGSVVVLATQPGNAIYSAAPPLEIIFSVGPPTPSTRFSDDAAATRINDARDVVTSLVSLGRP